MSSDFEIERHCSVDKKPGIVQLSTTHLVWTPDSVAHGNELRVAFSNIANFLVTKEAPAKKAMMRLKCSVAPETITLDFAKSFTERDAVRQVLDHLRPKEPTTTPISASTTLAVPTTPAKQVTPEELARRQTLLTRKEVRTLYAQLVRSGAVSDEIFWNAMRFRYKDTGEPRGRGALDLDDDDNADTDPSAIPQRRGVPSDAFVVGDGAAGAADSDSTVANATAKWTADIPSSAQRHIVFMEKPAVSRAHKEKVVHGDMSEQAFWALFLSSSLIGIRQRRRTKTDTARSAEADALFAPFEAEERRFAAAEQVERARTISRDLDVDRFDDHRGAHVLEGHTSASGAPRGTKDGRNAGIDSAAGIRLGRMMNRHGLLVLDEGGVDQWMAEAVDVVRPLEDLQVIADKPYSKLGVGSIDELAGGDAIRVGAGTEISQAVCQRFDGWEPDLSRFMEPVPGCAQRLDELLKCMVP